MNKSAPKLHRRFLGVALLLVTFLLLPGCNGQGGVSTTDFLMDTTIQSEILGANATDVYQKTNQMLIDFDQQYSMHQPQSDISKINEAAGKDYVPVAQGTYELLQEAVALCEKSGGKFDITIGSLALAWDVNAQNPQIPSITPQMLDLVNYKDILFRPEDKAVMLAHPGQIIDLGGIAKGAACDQLKQILETQKPESALVSFGGNIVGYGKDSFTIGIQDPREGGRMVGTVPLENNIIATSGDYQRFFEVDGVRYHHILDPATGFPFQSDFASVSVLASSGRMSDYLSTTLFMTDLEELKELRSNEEYSFIAIDHQKNVYVSHNLRDKFVMKDTSYRLQP